MKDSPIIIEKENHARIEIGKPRIKVFMEALLQRLPVSSRNPFYGQLTADHYHRTILRTLRQSARIKELEGLTGEVQVLERQKEDLKNRISDKEHELANCLDKITQLEQVNLQLEASGEKMASRLNQDYDLIGNDNFFKCSAKLDAEAVHRVQIEKLEEQHRSAADSKFLFTYLVVALRLFRCCVTSELFQQELELAECVRKIAQLEQDKVQLQHTLTHSYLQ
ncbi:hypothetical protein ACROYT_G005456 [Oculina patagonica]